jgi:hypothetical protein
MTWDRAAAAGALAGLLEAATDGAGVAVYPKPPKGFTPPALIVQLPTRVAKHSPAFGTDFTEWTVLVGVDIEGADELDDLLGVATAAVEDSPTLAGATAFTRVVEWRNWRILNVGGADYLVAEVALETRM